MIELKDVTKVYDAGARSLMALKHINIRVERGEFVAMTGPSGSGKSTMMNILGCLDEPTSGCYRLNGTPVCGLAADQLAQIRREQIGFVFQSFYLLPRLSAVENVELPMLYAGIPAKERRARACWLLEQAKLQDRKDHMPSQLSGGQCQRIAIARALANDPGIILADEPTGNLDSKMGEDIMNLLAGLNTKGKTLILITHDSTTAAYARRRIVMRDGELFEEEPACIGR